MSLMLISSLERMVEIPAMMPGRSSATTRISGCGCMNPFESLGIVSRVMFADSNAASRPSPVNCVRIPLSASIYRSIIPAISSRFVSQMSSHTSYGLDAIRVISRNPPAASRRKNGSSAFSRPTIFTSDTASIWGRWLIAAAIRSWRSGGIVTTFAPSCPKNSRSRSVGFSDAPSVGVST